jgi:hypothetical protein
MGFQKTPEFGVFALQLLQHLDLYNKWIRLKFNSINMVFVVILSIIFPRLNTQLYIHVIVE